jgi:hypothetical protein
MWVKPNNGVETLTAFVEAQSYQFVNSIICLPKKRKGRKSPHDRDPLRQAQTINEYIEKAGLNRKSRPALPSPTGFDLWGPFRLPDSAAFSVPLRVEGIIRRFPALAYPFYPIPNPTPVARECDGGSSLTVTCVWPSVAGGRASRWWRRQRIRLTGGS